ncbi:MAG: tRNA lysidine(34) synthetase TilS, partial [Haliea sp.]
MAASSTPKPTPPDKPLPSCAAAAASEDAGRAGLSSAVVPVTLQHIHPVAPITPTSPTGPNPALPALQAFFDLPGSRGSPSLFTSAVRQRQRGSHRVSLPIAVAYSGGADSTALLLAAAQCWPGQVMALHVHHGLQTAADGFVRTCASVCDALGVALHVVRVDAAHAQGESPEDAARLARYAALSAKAVEQGATGVLLGQHADDQVETLLLALSRGAGLPGLAGMARRFERGGMAFYRPLLQVSAAELRGWLQGAGVAFVDDPTNTDERFTRNRIRARLMPALLDSFPQARDTFARTARHAAQAQDVLVEIAAQDLAVAGVPPVIQRV